MADISRKNLQRTTLIFWALLAYMIAALVWWFISLENQNQRIAHEQLKNLQLEKNKPQSTQIVDKINAVQFEQEKNTRKYLAEGVTFLLLILGGAVFVYRSIRQQFKLQQQQQNFMMAVTHEFKTPIAVAKLNLETLLKYELDEVKRKKIIGTTLDETARLNFLTNNILLSAQLEGGRYRPSHEELDLSDLLNDCINDFKKRYNSRSFITNIIAAADVKGDALLLQMLINNLLENAVKYSPKDKPITLTLKKQGVKILLTISDEGPGIPEEEKKKVFSKFYRIGNEATRKTQGTGLGLYLCKKIAASHRADIQMTNNYPQGTTFTVNFST